MHDNILRYLLVCRNEELSKEAPSPLSSFPTSRLNVCPKRSLESISSHRVSIVIAQNTLQLLNKIKLTSLQMIDQLHIRYDQAQLNAMPQYQRLMQLYASLMPLLPMPMRDSADLPVFSRSPFWVKLFEDFIDCFTMQFKIFRLNLVENSQKFFLFRKHLNSQTIEAIICFEKLA